MEHPVRHDRGTGASPDRVRPWPALAKTLCALAFLALVPAAVAALAHPGAETGSEPLQQGPASPRFVLATEESGIDFVHHFGTGAGDTIAESGGSGGAWLDYDGDGRLDLMLVDGLPEWGGDPITATGAGHVLYRNHGARFVEVATSAGLRERTWGSGAAVADVDNDGHPDVLVTALGADRLFRNHGDGTFSARDVGVEDPGWSTTAAFTDWDVDGFVDLYVARYIDLDAAQVPSRESGLCLYRGVEVFCGPEGLAGARDEMYRNAADGTFVPWMEADVDPAATYGFALVATDCDGDALPEIYVASDSTINLLYRRRPEGGLEDWALFGGAGYSGDGREQAGMGATATDFDEDGRVDLFVTNFQNDSNTLYRNLGDCTFEDATAERGLAASSFPFMGWAAQFFDADGDGDQDLFVANGHIHPQLDVAGGEPFGQRNLLYRNALRETGDARFEEVGRSSGEGLAIAASSRGALRGDFDNDGDGDLLVTNVNDRPTLLRNDGPIAAAALQLSLVGRTSNRSALGATIRVDSGDVTQRLELRGSDGYAGSNDLRLLVHLPAGVADTVEIRWPSGGRTTLRDEGPGRLVLDEELGVIARAAR